MTFAIETRNLTVAYDDVVALDDVTLALPPGSLTGVLGPNGSGKSSLIKGLIGAAHTRGFARIEGSSGEAAARRVAYIPQQNAVPLDFPVTVEDVVWQGRYAHMGLLRRRRPEDLRAVERAIERVGIAEQRHRQIGALSGGQRQRAFFARALAREASVLLLDEPFAGLDATTEAALVEVLRELREDGATIVVVHHDLSTARAYYDHIVLLRTRLVAAGPTDEVFTPELLSQAYGGSVAIFFDRERTS